MPEKRGRLAARLCVLALVLLRMQASVFAQADIQPPKQPCPDLDEKATAAEHALCWFQRDRSSPQQCAARKEPLNACVAQANLWCVDASLDTDNVTNACFLSAVRAGQLHEARDIAQYLGTPSKTASTCMAVLKKASIRIVSNPPGAEVSVDGRSYGTAPVEVTLTGDWWQSRIVANFSTESGPAAVEVSSEQLLRALDREVCVFGDLVIGPSAEQTAPPSEAEPLPAAQPGAPPEDESPPKAEERPLPLPRIDESSAADASPADRDEGSSILPYIFMGTGAAVLAAAAVTGIMFLSAEDDLEDNCDHSIKTCDADQESTLDRADTLAVTTDILLVTGLAALGTGVVLMLLESGETGRAENATTLTSARPAASLDCSPDACFGSVTLGF